MDRHSSAWPGGPVPPAPYPHERMGGKYPPHEVDQHGPHAIVLSLAQVVQGDFPQTCNISLFMTVPDPRLLAVLSVAYEPDQVQDLGSLAASTIHLVSTEDLGRDPSPVEDLLGTAAAPAQLVQAGLRGVQFSPTEEVEGLRADLVLQAPTAAYDGGGLLNLGTGKWVAKARWFALRPMSEIEWRKAFAEMKLTASPSGLKVINVAIPG